MRTTQTLWWSILAFMVLAAALLVMNIEVEPQISSGMLVMMDDFSQDHSGWTTRQTGEAWAGIHEGALHISVIEANGSAWSLAGAGYEDVRIEVDAAAVEGNNQEQAGVICRAQDDANFYALLASSDGSAVIVRMRDGDAVVLRAREGIAYPVPGSIHLRADCVGPRLILSVNGRKWLETRDRSLETGRVGVMAVSGQAGGAALFFDNFMVYNP